MVYKITFSAQLNYNQKFAAKKKKPYIFLALFSPN